MGAWSGVSGPVVDRVAAAVRATPRVGFLPDWQQRNAPLDRALAIGYDATCSQPSTVVAMLELLDVMPGHRVLDVGSGSGWTTAILAHLVGPAGTVVGVDIVPELVEHAAERLRRAELTWATVVCAMPAALGAPGDGPFDRILLSADGGRVPEALVGQLVLGGRLVGPADGRMAIVDLSSEGPTISYGPGHYAFVPLR
jgi:protein-L-isoaspartate(D-aspartate) O-methyltransferase